MLRQQQVAENQTAEARRQDIASLYDKLKEHDFQGVITHANHILVSYLRVRDTVMRNMAYQTSAAAKAKLGDFNGALLDADSALQLDTDDISAYIARAAAKYGLEDYYGAIADADIAIKKSPLNEIPCYSCRSEESGW